MTIDPNTNNLTPATLLSDIGNNGELPVVLPAHLEHADTLTPLTDGHTTEQQQHQIGRGVLGMAQRSRGLSPAGTVVPPEDGLPPAPWTTMLQPKK